MGRHKKKKTKVKTKVKVKKRYKKFNPWKKKPVVMEETDMTNVKQTKFLGYCGKCKGIVTSLDKDSKFIYICPSCGKRARIKTLKDDLGIERPTSRKEYLEYSGKHSFSAAPVNDHVIEAKDLNVQE